MQNKHILYLIPTPIGKRKENLVLPEHTLDITRSLSSFIVEKTRTSIGFLEWINHPVEIHRMTFRVLNKKTPDHEVYGFLKLLENENTGLMSEAGAPGVADPGAKLVKLAHENGHRVVPLVGPSSILLALMASGLNGQCFSFHGYLPIDEKQRKKELLRLEEESRRHHRTQIVMDTPHRNRAFFSMLAETLQPATFLSIACNLTQPDEFIATKRMEEWKQASAPDMEKKPALFLICAG